MNNLKPSHSRRRLTITGATVISSKYLSYVWHNVVFWHTVHCLSQVANVCFVCYKGSAVAYVVIRNQHMQSSIEDRCGSCESLLQLVPSQYEQTAPHAIVEDSFAIRDQRCMQSANTSEDESDRCGRCGRVLQMVPSQYDPMAPSYWTCKCWTSKP